MPLTFPEVVDRSLLSAGAFRWRMGVRVLAAEFWLQPDDVRESDLTEKAVLLRDRADDVVAWLPGSESAGAELADLVAADLAVRGLSMAETGDHPIDRAGRSVQEDLCLLERRGSEWVLTAGSVCFPTRWALTDKIGRSLAAIHDPVPGYQHEIGARVERFFDAMKPDGLASRLNWSLVGDPSRRLDPFERQAPRAVPADLGRDLFVRVERQTLRRLRSHRAIVFGIRIHVWPLGEVIDLIAAESLVTTLETMPVDVANYKDLEGLRPALRAWLAAR